MGGTATTNQGNGIAIGYRAQFQVKDGSSGVAIGNSALENLVGQYSTALGDESGRYGEWFLQHICRKQSRKRWNNICSL